MSLIHNGMDSSNDLLSMSVCAGLVRLKQDHFVLSYPQYGTSSLDRAALYHNRRNATR